MGVSGIILSLRISLFRLFRKKPEKEALLFAARTSRAYILALLVLAEKQSHLCAERVKRAIKVVELMHSESCAQLRD